MLDRKTMLAVSAFVLLMLAGAIWLSGPMERWPVRAFFLPATVVILVGALQWRFAHAEGDLSAWRKWFGSLAITYAAISAGSVMKELQVTPLPAALPVIRLLIAFVGVQFLVLGNWLANRMRRPASLSLDRADEAAILRLGGWLLFAYGPVLIVSALLIPMSLIQPLVISTMLASLIAVVIRFRQPKAQIG
jgi:hypothetical protein